MKRDDEPRVEVECTSTDEDLKAGRLNMVIRLPLVRAVFTLSTPDGEVEIPFEPVSGFDPRPLACDRCDASFDEGDRVDANPEVYGLGWADVEDGGQCPVCEPGTLRARPPDPLPRATFGPDPRTGTTTTPRDPFTADTGPKVNALDPDHCPRCGGPLTYANEVDIGVGVMQGGPRGCDACQYVEPDPFDDGGES